MPLNESECSDYFLSFNESQQEAVKSALGGGAISLIQGPLGTGKTQVITEICLQLYRQKPAVRILVCSETHVAVNNLISRNPSTVSIFILSLLESGKRKRRGDI